MIPSCRFIWLIRDGRKVVASCYARGWFHSTDESKEEPVDEALPYNHMPLATVKPDPTSNDLAARHIYYRLNAAKCGLIAENKWKCMSPFERNCWYWSYVNQRIEECLFSVSDDRFLFMRLEDIQYKKKEMFQFLEVPLVEFQLPKLNAARTDVLSWKDWDKEKRYSFEQWCGKDMDRWYRGWRDDI
jgi:hypothetical protein